MKQIMQIFFASAIMLGLMTGGAFSAPGACPGARELRPAEVRAAVSAGRILSSPRTFAQAGIGPGTGKKVIRVSVCERGGQIFYRVLVLDGAKTTVMTLG